VTDRPDLDIEELLALLDSDHVQSMLRNVPPLSGRQRARLAELLQPIREKP
jgi:hypothetical protein